MEKLKKKTHFRAANKCSSIIFNFQLMCAPSKAKKKKNKNKLFIN